MFDRFKEFIGIDENYDDYDDEQLYYDDPNAIDDSYEESSRENYSDLMDEDYSYETTNTTVTYGSTDTSDSSYSSYSDNSYSSSDYSYEPETYSSRSRYQKSSKRGDSTSMTDSNYKPSNMRISIQEPLDYLTDAPIVVDEIINKKVVVLNLEMADADMRRQIIDFVSGAVYALEGKIEKVTKGIFVITPRGVEVDSSVTDQITDGNYNQL